MTVVLSDLRPLVLKGLQAHTLVRRNSPVIVGLPSGTEVAETESCNCQNATQQEFVLVAELDCMHLPQYQSFCSFTTCKVEACDGGEMMQ